MTPKQVVKEYITNVNKLAESGGYGHAFFYEGINASYKRCGTKKRPCHWVVKPATYRLVQPTNDQLMALQYYSHEKKDFWVYLSDIPSQEVWGN